MFHVECVCARASFSVVESCRCPFQHRQPEEPEKSVGARVRGARAARQSGHFAGRVYAQSAESSEMTVDVLEKNNQRGEGKLLSSARKLPEADRDPEESAGGSWRRIFSPLHTLSDEFDFSEALLKM
ncbi:uncharacterized [Lates japonicus]